MITRMICKSMANVSIRKKHGQIMKYKQIICQIDLRINCWKQTLIYQSGIFQYPYLVWGKFDINASPLDEIKTVPNFMWLIFSG